MLQAGDRIVIFVHTDGRQTMNRWDHYGDCCRHDAYGIGAGKSRPVMVEITYATGMKVIACKVLDWDLVPCGDDYQSLMTGAVYQIADRLVASR